MVLTASELIIDRGACAIDETETYMAVFNFHSGFDFYDLRQDLYIGTFRLETQENVALPVRFTSGHRKALLGTIDGQVKAVTVPGLIEVDCLEHGSCSHSTGFTVADHMVT